VIGLHRIRTLNQDNELNSLILQEAKFRIRDEVADMTMRCVVRRAVVHVYAAMVEDRKNSRNPLI
jgi:hypothetical protein